MSVEVLDLLDDRSSLICKYILENMALHQDMDFAKNLGEARQVLADLQEAGGVFSAGGEKRSPSVLQLGSFLRKWKTSNLAPSEDATRKQLMLNNPIFEGSGLLFPGPVDALHPCSGVGEVLASRRNEEVERKPWGPTKQHRPNAIATWVPDGDVWSSHSSGIWCRAV